MLSLQEILLKEYATQLLEKTLSVQYTSSRSRLGGIPVFAVALYGQSEYSDNRRVTTLGILVFWILFCRSLLPEQLLIYAIYYSYKKLCPLHYLFAVHHFCMCFLVASV